MAGVVKGEQGIVGLRKTGLGKTELGQLAGWMSPAIAVLLMLVWAISLVTIGRLPFGGVPLWGKVCLLLWQTFLYTGLFVTAHDAMHGAVCPHHRTLNDTIGTAALALYGLFSFRELRHRHHLHHQNPASGQDPDYFRGDVSGFWQWYGQFMTRYWHWPRFFVLVLVFHGLHRMGVVEANLAWGWVYPSVLSSMHLFYFGTYLPHRQPPHGYADAHCSTTIARPFLFSLLACYHFGYHHEHHEHPTVPWWQLPQIYRQRQGMVRNPAPSRFTSVQDL